jgi:hypothetical protein
MSAQAKSSQGPISTTSWAPGWANVIPAMQEVDQVNLGSKQDKAKNAQDTISTGFSNWAWWFVPVIPTIWSRLA